MPTEADTCRKYVVPRLQDAGWDADPYLCKESRFGLELDAHRTQVITQENLLLKSAAELEALLPAVLEREMGGGELT